MNIEISPKVKQDFNKNWKKLTANSAYLIPETKEDFKSLGPFPYFQINNIWAYPKNHIRQVVQHVIFLIHQIVGQEFFTRRTVSEAIRDEIKLHFRNEEKRPIDWHLSHLVKTIESKRKKRLFVRAITGLELVDLSDIKNGSWQIIPFTTSQIDQFVKKESSDEERKSHIKDYLSKTFKDKLCFLIEAEGDQDTAKGKAQNIATFVINTLRYFLCIHVSSTGHAHDVGINLDFPNQNPGFNGLSMNVEDGFIAIFGYRDRPRKRYPLNKENLDIIKSDCHAEVVWSLIEKRNLSDLEASIVSAINWFGDAHQENDINAAYIKYWIALEALVTGHKKEDTTTRIKNAIPIMISQTGTKAPTKTEVAEAYDLRCRVVHCGIKDMVSMKFLNKLCFWVTQCLSLCIHLSHRGYMTRKQIEFQTDRINRLSKPMAPQ